MRYLEGKWKINVNWVSTKLNYLHFKKITLIYQTSKYSQWAGILLCEVRQIDISKVDEEHPNCLFWGVQKPAHTRLRYFQGTPVGLMRFLCIEINLALARFPYQIFQGLLSCLGSLKRFTVEERECHTDSGILQTELHTFKHSLLFSLNKVTQPSSEPSNLQWAFYCFRIWIPVYSKTLAVVALISVN